ncbi:MAG: bile acid:sodium symporter family protein [Pseudomonadota bacterium]
MLLTVVLPVSLAFIMFSLGLGLTIADFARVAKVPKAFAVGAFAQLAILPLIAFILLLIFPLPPNIAVGVMILSFCPGGVTSNILTKLSGGTLALSITLTAVVSLMAVITVPFLVAWSADHFMGLAAPDVDVTALGISMFMITAVPVALGVAARRFAPGFAISAEPWASRIATALFVIIVIAAVATNWQLFIDNLPLLGPVLIALNALMLIIGVVLARSAGLDRRDSIAIALEAGVQNATLGITVGGLIAAGATGFSPFALASGVYGITMYLVTAPFILWARRGAGG